MEARWRENTRDRERERERERREKRDKREKREKGGEIRQKSEGEEIVFNESEYKYK